MESISFISAPGKKRLKPLKHECSTVVTDRRYVTLYIINQKDGVIKLKHLKFNFTNDEGKGQMPVRNKLKKIRLLSQSSSSSMILNLPKVKRGKFLFGDLKGFVEKVNRLHRVIVLKRVCNEYKEYNNTVRNKSVFIRDNNISMLKYKQSLQRAYDVFKMEYEYKRRLKILRIYKLIQLIITYMY